MCDLDVITVEGITNLMMLLVLYKLCKSCGFPYHELNLYCIAPCFQKFL